MKKLSLILALCIGSIAYAQDAFEGTIEYEITYEDLAAEYEQMKSMLPNSTIVQLKDGITKTSTPNGMGGETIVLNDVNTGNIITLMDLMGNKLAIRSNANDESKQEDPEIEYLDEEKEIMGYKCKKALLNMEEQDIEIEVFYTEELPNVQANNMVKGIKGMPMQITIAMEPYTLIQTVTKIEKGKVKKIKMEVPSDYEEKTTEELQQMFGGGM